MSNGACSYCWKPTGLWLLEDVISINPGSESVVLEADTDPRRPAIKVAVAAAGDFLLSHKVTRHRLVTFPRLADESVCWKKLGNC